MSTIKATFRNGRIEPHEPLDLPDGTALQITLPDEGDESLSQAEIDRVLAAMDQIIPFDMSP